jgi:hypothetical protein
VRQCRDRIAQLFDVSGLVVFDRPGDREGFFAELCQQCLELWRVDRVGLQVGLVRLSRSLQISVAAGPSTLPRASSQLWIFFTAAETVKPFTPSLRCWIVAIN